MKLIFLGPPGAGKGTIADLAAPALGLPHISTGDLFRAAVKDETPLGLKVKGILASGGLVPDELTIALVLLIMGFVLVLFSLAERLERRLLRWRYA